MRFLFVLAALACVAVYCAHARSEGMQPPPSLDGTGHGQQGLRGGAGSLLRRLVPKPGVSGDQVDEGNLPNARAVSNAVVRQQGDTSQSPLSAATWWFGQFLDHDLTFNKDVGEDLFIDVTGDEHFDPEGNGDFIEVRRADFLYDAQGTRQLVNDVTSFVDLSVVYGASNFRAHFLRAYTDGLLRSQLIGELGEFAPYNTHGVPNLGGDFDESFFLFGDFRGNENEFLVAIQTLFLRNHNYWARAFKAEHANWDDDRVFNAARRWNIAEYQNVVYNEFLPTILGESALEPPAGFDRTVDPSLFAEFSTAGWRVGHTLLNEHIERRNPSTGTLEDRQLLSESFMDISEVLQHGVERVILGLTTTQAMDIDNSIVDSVRDRLFLGPGFGVSLDLAAINILRARETAMPSYVELRAQLGLPPLAFFSDLSSDPRTVANLESVYTSVNDIDLWIGLLAEDKEEGSQFGRALHRLLTLQYTALRDGDLYYFEYDPFLSRAERNEIRSTSMADLVARNTNIERSLLPDSYFMRQYL